MRHISRSISHPQRGLTSVASGAPDELRRRVLHSVQREVEPAAEPYHGARDRRPRRIHPALLALIATTAAVFTTAVSIPIGSSNGKVTGTARIAPSLRTAHATLKRMGSHAELVVSGMPEPPAGEVYEVWLRRATGAPQPTDALFTVTRTGSASVDVPGNLRGVREVMVTSEPLGGRTHPTNPAVLSVALAGAG